MEQSNTGPPAPSSSVNIKVDSASGSEDETNDGIPPAGPSTTERVGSDTDSTEYLAPDPSPLYIDWGKEKKNIGPKIKEGKGLVIFDGKKIQTQMTIPKMVEFYPPPHEVRIEGAPPFFRDELAEAGYVVYTTSTQQTQAVRETEGLGKSDKTDVRILARLPEDAWHLWTPTEPKLKALNVLLSKRRMIQGHDKLIKQHSHLEGYTYKDIEGAEYYKKKLAEIDKELTETCESLGFHEVHEGIPGVGCVVAMYAIATRPWTFDHGEGGWLHHIGLTSKARDRFYRRHSLGCNPEFKSVLYRARMGLTSKTSPYYQFYEDKKVEFEANPEFKEVRKGRGKVYDEDGCEIELNNAEQDEVTIPSDGKARKTRRLKVAASNRAFNRVETKVAKDLYKKIMIWTKAASL